jgi:hypothetical protein
MTAYLCPICGYDGLDEPAYSAKGFGSYEICSCCRYEYGVTDDDKGITHEQWRQQWIDEGMIWRSNVTPQPIDWDSAAQVARVQPPSTRPEQMTTYMCPVCGYDGLDMPAYEPNSGESSLEICPSCGYQYGYDDDSEGITHEEWRQTWITSGMVWWSKRSVPADWDPAAQIARVLPRG